MLHCSRKVRLPPGQNLLQKAFQEFVRARSEGRHLCIAQACWADRWADTVCMGSHGPFITHLMPPEVLQDSANLLRVLLLSLCAASVTKFLPRVPFNRHIAPRSLLNEVAARMLQ